MSARSRHGSRVVVSSARRGVLLLSPPPAPARSPSEGPAAPAEAAAVPILQQLPPARSHHRGRVRAAADAEMMKYRSASVAFPPMA